MASSATATLYSTSTIFSTTTGESLSTAVQTGPATTSTIVSNGTASNTVFPGSASTSIATVFTTQTFTALTSSPVTTLFGTATATTSTTSRTTSATIQTSSTITLTSAAPLTTLTQTTTIPFSSTSDPNASSTASASSTVGLNNGGNNLSSSTPVGPIVGGVVGGVVGLIILAALLWFCCVKRSRNDLKDDFDFAGDDAWDPARGAGGVVSQSTSARRRNSSAARDDMAMNGFDGAYASGTSRDQQRDYYAVPNSHQGMSMSTAPSVASAGLAGVGVLRREPSQNMMGRDAPSDAFSGMDHVSMGNEGGYGVAHSASMNSYGRHNGGLDRQPSRYTQNNYPEGYQVSPPLGPSSGQLPSAYQVPTAAYPSSQSELPYHLDSPQKPLGRTHPSISRLDSASPVPSHRSLPGGAVTDTGASRIGGPLTVRNNQQNNEDDDGFYNSQRFGGGNDAYSGLTAGLRDEER